VEVALSPATAGAVACNASNGILGVSINPGSSLSQGSGNTFPGAGASAAPSQSSSATGSAG
jgi:hypothetical protein